MELRFVVRRLISPAVFIVQLIQAVDAEKKPVRDFKAVRLLQPGFKLNRTAEFMSRINRFYRFYLNWGTSGSYTLIQLRNYASIKSSLYIKAHIKQQVIDCARTFNEVLIRKIILPVLVFEPMSCPLVPS